MLLSRQRIAESVLETLERLQQRHDIPKDVGYDLAAAATALRHLQHVDHGGDQSVLTFGGQILTSLQAIRATPLSGIAVAPQVHELLDTAIGAARRLVDSPLVGGELKRTFATFLREIDVSFSEIATLAPNDAALLFAPFAAELLQHHSGFELFDKDLPVAAQELSPGEPLTEGNLTAYFREKLSDPTALASNVIVLPGGFGKETSLFSVSSRTLNADLVMRRDAPLDSFSGLDCHTAPREFPLLRAVHARGFPAPEPIFFEEQSKIISGPAFTVMRRAPGAVAGDATGGQGRVPAALQSALAQIAARLHALVPLTELVANPAFSAALWNQSAEQCTRDYLTTWYRLYRDTAHLPAPAMHGLFNWMLAHSPKASARASLVHGDIGFHNLLFDDGQLSAVLDWEFSHVGDPAEDLGYIRSVMGGQLDWPQFMAAYVAAGGGDPGEQRVRFFEIWSHVRNAASSLMVTDNFETGRFRHIKYTMIVHRFVPHFIARAAALIAAFGTH